MNFKCCVKISSLALIEFTNIWLQQPDNINIYFLKLKREAEKITCCRCCTLAAIANLQFSKCVVYLEVRDINCLLYVQYGLWCFMEQA